MMILSHNTFYCISCIRPSKRAPLRHCVTRFQRSFKRSQDLCYSTGSRLLVRAVKQSEQNSSERTKEGSDNNEIILISCCCSLMTNLKNTIFNERSPFNASFVSSTVQFFASNDTGAADCRSRYRGDIHGG